MPNRDGVQLSPLDFYLFLVGPLECDILSSRLHCAREARNVIVDNVLKKERKCGFLTFSSPLSITFYTHFFFSFSLSSNDNDNNFIFTAFIHSTKAPLLERERYKRNPNKIHNYIKFNYGVKM